MRGASAITDVKRWVTPCEREGAGVPASIPQLAAVKGRRAPNTTVLVTLVRGHARKTVTLRGVGSCAAL